MEIILFSKDASTKDILKLTCGIDEYNREVIILRIYDGPDAQIYEMNVSADELYQAVCALS